MSFTVITNNTAFRDKYESELDVFYKDVSLRDIFLIVRDRVHEGYEILTHPLSGSVKPGETPFKTVFISKKKGTLNMGSLSLIENAILTCDKFEERAFSFPGKTEDFQVIDLSLAEAALGSLRAF